MTTTGRTLRVLIGICAACVVRAESARASTALIGASPADRSADSLYRAGREALARREYQGAADLFERVVSRYPAAQAAGNAHYWRAYALYVSGKTAHDLRTLRNATDALDAAAARYPAASTARQGLDLRARVVTAEAMLGDTPARHALDAAVSALARPVSCDDIDLPLKLVALERLIDRDPESAMPTIRRVLSIQGRCMAAVRRATMVVVASTPAMDVTTLENELAREDRSLQPVATAAVAVGAPDRSWDTVIVDQAPAVAAPRLVTPRDCASLHRMSTEHFPTIVSDSDPPMARDAGRAGEGPDSSGTRNPHDSVLVVILDANGNLVRGLLATGTVGIRVAKASGGAADTAQHQGVTYCAVAPLKASGQHLGGITENGQANGHTTTLLKGVLRPGMREAQLMCGAMACPAATPCCAPWKVAPVVMSPTQLWLRQNFFAEDSTGYVAGIETVRNGFPGSSPASPSLSPPNHDRGLVAPVGGASGIEGIPASQVLSVDVVTLLLGRQVPRRSAWVVVVTLAAAHDPAIEGARRSGIAAAPRATVVTLSIITCDSARKPLPGDGSMVKRKSGASTSVLVTGTSVTLRWTSLKTSACTTSAGRGFP